VSSHKRLSKKINKPSLEGAKGSTKGELELPHKRGPSAKRLK